MTMFLCFRSQLWLRQRLLHRAYHDLLILVVVTPALPPFDVAAIDDDELLSTLGRQLIFVVNVLLSSLQICVTEFPSAPFSVVAVDVDDMSLAVESVIVLLLLALPFTIPLTTHKSPATAFFEFVDADIIWFAVSACAHSSALDKNWKKIFLLFYFLCFGFRSWVHSIMHSILLTVQVHS